MDGISDGLWIVLGVLSGLAALPLLFFLLFFGRRRLVAFLTAVAVFTVYCAISYVLMRMSNDFGVIMMFASAWVGTGLLGFALLLRVVRERRPHSALGQ